MSTPQPGVFAQGTRAHRHLEYDVRPGVDADAVLDALRGLRQPSVTAGGVNIVVGFAPDRWRAIAGPEAPEHPATFPDLAGVAATPHDVWVWLHGTGDDALFDVARSVHALLAPVAEPVAEISGFVYHDSRDLTGFVDGTENPSIEEAYAVAALPAGARGAGGCFAMTQRWIHDLAAFRALSDREQELVIGRTKLDSIELDDEAKPPTAHIARVVMEDAAGEEIEIYRRSVPYGTASEHGLYFVAFSADPDRFSAMLTRMFGAAPDGLRDRLTEFTRPVTGAFYFVPSLEQLGEALG